MWPFDQSQTAPAQPKQPTTPTPSAPVKAARPQQPVAQPVQPVPEPQQPQTDDISLDEFEDRVAKHFKIPRGLRMALKNQESGGQDTDKKGGVLTSPKGALGRLQVMPDTVRMYGKNPDDEFDRVYAGLRYLRENFDKAQGANDVEKWTAAIAGYHGGGSQVNHINKTGEIADRSDGLTTTPKYVDSIMKKWQGAGRMGEAPEMAPLQPVGEPVPKTASPKRQQQAAQVMNQIESLRSKAVALFKQADGARGQGAAPDARGMAQKDSTGQVISQESRLRAQAEGALEQANMLAKQAQGEYSDLLEIGFGSDADKQSNRKWAYAKPRRVAAKTYLDDQGRTTSQYKQENGQIVRDAQGRPVKEGTLTDTSIAHPGVSYYGRPGFEQTAAAATREEIQAAIIQRRRIEEERKRYESRSMLGRMAERAGTYALASNPSSGASPEVQEANAIRRAATGMSLGDEPSGVEQGIGKLARAALTGFAQMPEGFGRMADLITSLDPNAKPYYQSMGRRLSDPMTEAAKAFTRVDEKNNGFWSSKVPEAFGSALPFLLGGGAARAVGLGEKVGSGLLGAASQVGQAEEEIRKSGIDPQRHAISTLVSALTGATEAFGINLDKTWVGKKLGERVLSVLEESGQEGVQSLLEDINAQFIGAYDPKRGVDLNREYLWKILESAALGGIVGTGFQGSGYAAEKVGDVLDARRQKKAGPTPVSINSLQPQVGAVAGAPPAAPAPPGASGAQTAQTAPLDTTEPLAPPVDAQAAPEDLPVAEAPKRGFLAKLGLGRSKEKLGAEGLDEGLSQVMATLDKMANPKAQQAKEKEAAKESERVANFDEAVRLAGESETAAKDLVAQGQFEQAAQEMDFQIRSIGDQIKYLPAGPEAQKQRRDLQRRIAEIKGQAATLKKQATKAASGPQTAETAPLSTGPTSVDVFRSEANQSKQDASQFQDEGRFADAAREYEAAKNALKGLRREIAKDKTMDPGEKATRITDIDRDISRANELFQEMKKSASKAEIDQRKADRQAAIAKATRPFDYNAPTDRELGSGESKPLFQSPSNPEGGVPEIPTEDVDFTKLAERQERGEGEPLDNKRLVSRVRELGGINPGGVYSGELQGAKDKRYPGLINRKSGKSPDEIREMLQQDGYEVGDDLDSLFRALDADIAGQEQYPLTRSRSGDLQQEFEDYYARQQEDENAAMNAPTERELQAPAAVEEPQDEESFTDEDFDLEEREISPRAMTEELVAPETVSDEDADTSEDFDYEEKSVPLRMPTEELAGARSSRMLSPPPAPTPPPVKRLPGVNAAMQQAIDELDPEDRAAIERAIRGSGERPGPGHGFSFSPHADIITNNREDVMRLFSISLASPEGQAIVQKLRDYTKKRNIEPKYLGNLLNYIRNNELDIARLEDRGLDPAEVRADPTTGDLRDYYSRPDEMPARRKAIAQESERLLKEEAELDRQIKTEVRKDGPEAAQWYRDFDQSLEEISLAVTSDPAMMQAYDAAIAGGETEFAAFEELVNEQGLDIEAARQIVDLDRQGRSTDEGKRTESAKDDRRGQEGAPPPPPSGREAADEGEKRAKLTPDDHKLLRRPILAPYLSDEDIDPHIRALEARLNEGIHSGWDPEGPEYKLFRNALINVGKERTRRVAKGRLPAKNPKGRVPFSEERKAKRALEEEIKDLSEDEKKARRDALAEDLEARFGGRSARKLNKAELAAVMAGEIDADVAEQSEVPLRGQKRKKLTLEQKKALRQLKYKAAEYSELTEDEAQQIIDAGRVKGDAPVKLSHPDPDIDGKVIIGETDDGRVIVKNPKNKGGESVVKDRGDVETEYSSSSTQVNLPPDIAQQVLDFGEKIPDRELAEDGREKNPHVTVLYGLKGSRKKKVEQALKDQGPITGTLGQLSLFKNDDADVLKIEVKSEDLEAANASIKEEVPNEQTHPEYIPHVTVAYLKPGEGDKYVGDKTFDGVEFTSDVVEFSGKYGNKEDIKLEAAPAAPEVPPEKADAKSQITDQILRLSGRSVSRVRIADLHAALPSVPFNELRDNLIQMMRAGEIELIRNDDNFDITPDDLSSSVYAGGQQNHIVYPTGLIESIRKEPEAKPEPEPDLLYQNSDDDAVTGIANYFLNGMKFSSITAARTYLSDITGEQYKGGTPAAKRADEIIEAGIVKAARKIVDSFSGDDQRIYQELMDLYERQPNLNVRTSTSIAQQAYSTPVPLAFVAARLAGIDQRTTVYEPTAGNGSLLLTADPENVTANELNEDRYEALKEMLPGANIRNDNALSVRIPAKSFDSIIANPPFGIIKNEQGKTIRYDIEGKYTSGEIDHAIAFEALKAMKDGGRAVLIVGGLKSTDPKQRSDGYNAAAKRRFYYTLYNQYNVSDHFTVSGDLYSKQGAGWPVDVIVINGRGKSSLPLPAASPPRIYENYEAIGGLLTEQAASPVRLGAEGELGTRSGEGRPEPKADAGSVSGVPDRSGQGTRRQGGRRAGVPDTESKSGGAPAADIQPERKPGQGSQQPDLQQPVTGRPAESVKSDAGKDQSVEGRSESTRSARTDDAGKLDKRADEGAGRTSSVKAEEAFDSQFDDIFGVEPAAKEEAGRTAKEAAKSAAEQTAKSLDEAAKGLMELFGGKDVNFSGGIGFNEKTYQKAKPHFETAVAHFKGAVTDVNEVMRKLLEYLRDVHKMTRETALAMRPYITRFVDEFTGSAKADVAPKTETKTTATTAPAVTTDEADSGGSETHRAYKPSSKGKYLNTLVPINMATAVDKSLKRLKDQVGNLDDYVADKLGYEKDDSKFKDLSAEQVDAIAMAVNNIEKGGGFIIGDQTGIGKGRIVAGIIRYAVKQGKVPIFVTEKPTLYGDMVRDLNDIGSSDIKPFITNAGESIPLTDDALAWYEQAEQAKLRNIPVPKQPSEGFLKTPAGKTHEAEMHRMISTGQMGQYDAIFTTYNQMQSVQGKTGARHNLLRQFADNSVIIFDESHNAGGAGKIEVEGEGGRIKFNRAQFARDLAKQAQGVLYSSATFAKRPEVMDLYFRTELGQAVSNVAQLSEITSKGGVPMQQIIASQLAEAGQYLRRERSFKGVEYSPTPVKVDRKSAENISKTMQLVAQFDELKEAAVAAMDEQIKSEARSVTVDGSIGQAGIHSTNFTSIMHNLIDQMLLATKVDGAVDMAIEALERGEKPVITVANTMGSFIQQFAEENEMKPGEAITLNFKDLLHRYLKRSRRVIIGKPYGEKESYELSDAELGPMAVLAYERAEKFIDSLDLSAPVSPIDWIHYRLKKAGYRTSEITGRGHTIEYADEGASYRVRPASETSTAAKKRTINEFNGGTISKDRPNKRDGSIDVIILNQSGSTGISLHASDKFGDQRRRHMIIAQAEKNIDTHMQMLGRVHRTGQVLPPRYSQMVADIPAELRPAAILAKKMASLNANTTASRGSAVTAKDVPDFLNKYGDEVAAGMMDADHDLHKKLGTPLKMDDKGEGFAREDAMRKVTGRIPLLTLAEQEKVYDALQEEYEEYLQQLTAMGENALEARTLDLDAETMSTLEVIPGKGPGVFQQPALLEKVKSKRQGKPFKSEEVLSKLRESVEGADSDSDLDQIQRLGHTEMYKRFSDLDGEVAKYKAQIEEERGGDRRAEIDQKTADQWLSRWRKITATVSPGATVSLASDNGLMYGVVLSVDRKGKGGNPVALGRWRATIAVASSQRQVTVPFSRMDVGEATAGASRVFISPEDTMQVYNPDQGRFERDDIINGFDRGWSDSRENRQIFTGNLIAAFAQFPRGQISNFTDNQGNIRQGLIAPEGVDAIKEMDKKAVAFGTPEQAAEYLTNPSGGKIASEDGEVSVFKSSRGAFVLSVPAAKGRGARYYLNDKLQDALGTEFVKSGGHMIASVGDLEIRKAIEVLMSGATGGPLSLTAVGNKDLARKIMGIEAPVEKKKSADPPIVEDALKRLQSNLKGTQAGSGAQALADVAIVAGYRLYRAGMSFAKWSREMIGEFGQQIRPHLNSAWKAIQQGGAPDAAARAEDRVQSLNEKQERLSAASEETADTVEGLEEQKASLQDELDAIQSAMESSVGRRMQGPVQKAYKEAMAKVDRQIATAQKKATKQDVRAQSAEEEATATQEQLDLASGETDEASSLPEFVEKAREEIEAASGTGKPPSGLALARYIGWSNYQPDRNRPEWARAVVREAGPSVAAHLEKAWQEIKRAKDHPGPRVRFYWGEGPNPESPGGHMANFMGLGSLATGLANLGTKFQTQRAVPGSAGLPVDWDISKWAKSTIGHLRKGIASGSINAKQANEVMQAIQKVVAADQAKDGIALFLAREELAKITSDKVTIGDILGAPRSIKAGLDFSYAFRQGGAYNYPGLFTKPVETVARILKGVAAVKEQNFGAINAQIAESPNFRAMMDSGLHLANHKKVEGGNNLNDREEAYIARFMQDIPGYKQSERGNTTLMDLLRADRFDSYVALMAKGGLTPQNSPEAFKEIAKFINMMTGRGNFGKFESAVPALSNALFSPRWVKSRIDMFGKFFRVTAGEGLSTLRLADNARANKIAGTKGLDTATRRRMFWEMGSYAGITALTLGMIAAAGYGLAQYVDIDVGDEPDEPNFGKVVINGKYHYDLTSGLQQYVVFAMRMAKAFKNTYGSGKSRNPNAKAPSDVLLRFLRSKASPAGSLAANIFTGETYTGDKISPTGAILDLFYPLIIKDFMDGYNIEGAAGGSFGRRVMGGAMSLPATVGFGFGAYEEGGAAKRVEGLRKEADKHDVFFKEEPIEGEPESLTKERYARRREYVQKYGPPLVNSDFYKQADEATQKKILTRFKEASDDASNEKKPRIDRLTVEGIRASLKRGAKQAATMEKNKQKKQVYATPKSF